MHSSREPLSPRLKRRDERFGRKKFAERVDGGNRVGGRYAIPNTGSSVNKVLTANITINTRKQKSVRHARTET